MARRRQPTGTVLDELQPATAASTGTVLDELPRTGTVLDELLPDAQQGQTLKDKFLTPIPELAAAGHKVGDAIRGYQTPAPEIEKKAPSALELIQGIVTAPLRGYRDFAEALPGAVSAFTEQPAAAARGLGAGLVESLTTQSPLDLIMTAVGGPKAIKSAKSVAKGTARGVGNLAERVTNPQAAGFRRASKAATQNVTQSLPEVMSDTFRPQSQLRDKAGQVTPARPMREHVRVGETQPDWMRSVLEEVRGELDRTPLNRAEKPAGLPSPEELAMPKVLSRGEPDVTKPTTPKSPAIPDPGSMMGFAVDSGRGAVGASRRITREIAEKNALARAARKKEIDEAAAAVLPEDGPAPASIVERSEALAKKINEDRPPAAPMVPQAPEGITAAAEAIESRLGRYADPSEVAAAASPGAMLDAALKLAGKSPDPNAFSRIAQQLQNVPPEIARDMAEGRPAGAAGVRPTTVEGKSGTPAAATPPATQATMGFKPASKTAPSKIEASIGKSEAPKASLTARLQEQVAAVDTIEKAATLRDKFTKEAGAKGVKPEKAAIYMQAARAASAKINEFAKGAFATKPATPAPVAPPAPPAVPVQRFDIQGKPVAAPPTPNPRLPPEFVPRGAEEAYNATRPESTGPDVNLPIQRPVRQEIKTGISLEPPKVEMESLPEFIKRTTGLEPGQFNELSAGEKSTLYGKYRTEAQPKGGAPAAPEAPSAPVDDASARLIKMAEEAGAGPPPPGVDPVTHANMFALENEARAAVAKGVKDPRVIDVMRRYHGTKAAAQRLGLKQSEVEKISGPPHKRRPMTQVMAEMDARFKYLMDDPKGFMRTEAMLAAAGAAAGGLVGGMIEGEDALERAAWVLSGAAIGGLAGARYAKSGKVATTEAKVKGKLKVAAEHALELDTANLLLGPAIIKTSLGSLAGVAASYWELVSQGKTRQARAMLQYIKHEAAGDYIRQLTAPTDKLPRVGLYTQTMAQKAGLPPPKKGIGRAIRHTSAFVLRPFIAGDVVGSKALARGGFSKAEAQRQMLVGEPTTWQAQAALKVLESTLAWRFFAKFPRVRLGSLERGVEYTPGLNRMLNMRHKKKDVGMHHLSEQEGLTSGQLRARAQFGGAALLLGTAYGYYMDPSLAHGSLAASAAGPAFVPAGAGITAGKAIRNKGLQTAAGDVLLNIIGQIPQISEAEARPGRIAQRVVPFRPLSRMLEQMFGEEE